MPDTMSKRERVQAALAGEAVDHPPASMWRHFFEVEATGDGLAEAMVGFQRRFQWDFLKVNERARFPTEDWGAQLQWSADPLSGPTLLKAAVTRPEQWQQIEARDPHRGVMGEHLHALSRITRELEGEVPVVMTVFNPISVAGALLERPETLVEHLGERPQEVQAALEAITETLATFAQECLNAGADGVFFPTTIWGSRDLLSDEEYDRFARPYDLRILEAVREARFNILHVCNTNNRLLSLLDYPVHALNWDDRDPTNPALADIRARTDKALIGGMARQGVLRYGSPQEVRQQVEDAQQQTKGQRWLLGPTCAIPPDTPEENLQAALDTLRR